MLALIQRVSSAEVVVNEKSIGAIDQGIMALIAIEQGDTKAEAKRLVDKLLNYRIFSDDQDKMNLSVKSIEGAVLLIPQFTLAAETKKGLRPSFSKAASPDLSKALFDYFCEYASLQHSKVQTGRFGADMKVSLCNDGPVTFMLQIKQSS